jgi:hypothetical protein
MFKIKRTDLQFALSLSSKALAQRQQEEVIYRSVRIQTFQSENKNYVMFSANGGHNAVKTTGFPITSYEQPLDVLVECTRLLEVVDKASVEEIVIERLDDENILVTANGENKLRYTSGEVALEFAKYDMNKSLGSMKVKRFMRLCKLASPYATDDIHKAPLIGLCIDNNSIYASDEFKGITIENIGLNIEFQLTFNPIVTEMIKMFADDADANLYLGRMSESHEDTHLVLNIDGVELYILKYQTDYPSNVMVSLNKKFREKHTYSITVVKSDVIQSLNRIGVFVDDNDLLGVMSLKNEENDSVILEVINAKTAEGSKEEVPATLEIDEEYIGRKFYISLSNFKVLLDSIDENAVTFKFSPDTNFISTEINDYLVWLTQKKLD